jgi:hypothetical protein
VEGTALGGFSPLPGAHLPLDKNRDRHANRGAGQQPFVIRVHFSINLLSARAYHLIEAGAGDFLLDDLFIRARVQIESALALRCASVPDGRRSFSYAATISGTNLSRLGKLSVDPSHLPAGAGPRSSLRGKIDLDQGPG